MKIELIILFLISFVESSTYSPSKEIWNKTLSAIKNGEIALPESKGYFIFDEKNYLKEEINSTKMLDLYEKQEQLYVNDGILNYFFLVENIDEDSEDLETCADNIIKYINKEFLFTLKKSIIVLFSITSKRLRIQPGTELSSKFSENVCDQMIKNLGSYMRSTDYYNALVQVIKDADSYYNKRTPDPDPDTNSGSGSGSSLSIGNILTIIIILIILVLAVIYKRKHGSTSVSYDYTTTSHYSPPSHYHPPRHHSPPRHHGGGGHSSGGRSGGGRSGGGRSGGGGGKSGGGKGGASGGW